MDSYYPFSREDHTRRLVSSCQPSLKSRCYGLLRKSTEESEGYNRQIQSLLGKPDGTEKSCEYGRIIFLTRAIDIKGGIKSNDIDGTHHNISI